MRILLSLTNKVKSFINQSFIRPKRSLILAAIALGITALALMAPRFLSQRSSAHSLATAKPKQQGCCADMPAIPRRMIGTYYTTEAGFRSTLVLNNKGPNQIAVTPILHGQNEQTFTAEPVAVAGQSSSEVDLNALAISAGLQFRSGSFEFTYSGRLLEMGGGLRIVDADRSLIFDEQMLEPGMKFPSPHLEAVYAVPFDTAQVSVIVTNTTAEPLTVNGDAIFEGLYGHHPIHEQLRPYDTQVIKLPHGLVKKASAGAVSLNHTGGQGALLAMIHLQESEKGYSEAVNFNDPTHGKTTQLHGAGLRLGSIDGDALSPVIAVRNVGADVTTVTANVPYTKQNGSTGKISLPRISLEPGEIKLLNTAKSRPRRNDFDTAGLEIEYTGTPGSVIASASSVSQSGNHVFALPMKDPQGGLSSTGGYPWFINEKGSTVVFIKNTTEKPQKSHLDVVYHGGRWGSNLRTLAPGQTFALDVRAIRDSQEKGAGDNTIPLDATVGHISWSVYGTGANKTLIGRAQTVDFTKGIASTYECQCPCGATYNNGRLVPTSVTGVPGDTQQFLAQQRDMDCLGNLTEWYDVNAAGGFSSDNPDVATCDLSGFATAVAPGTTNIRASWFASIISYEGDPLHCESFDTTATGEAFCEVSAPPCAVPVRFRQVGDPVTISAGVLRFRYAWESSIGPVTNLSNCTVGEHVDYPGPGPKFRWPSPPFGHAEWDDPTVIDVPATRGEFTDDHTIPGGGLGGPPPGEFIITAFQTYRYRCPCANNGQYVNINDVVIPIDRHVGPNGRGGWRYRVTKNGWYAEVDPIP